MCYWEIGLSGCGWRSDEMVVDKSRVFSSKFMFKALHSSLHEPFPWQAVWRSYGSQKSAS